MRIVRLAILVACSLFTWPAHAQAQQARIVAFGDSITWGANATNNSVQHYRPLLPLIWHTPGKQDTTYPGVLQRMARRTVLDYGVPGETTAEGLPRLIQLMAAIRPRLVLLMEGTNDMLAASPLSGAIDSLTAEVRAVQHGGGTAILMTVPRTYYPFGNPSYAVNARIVELNTAIRQLAMQLPVSLVDVEAAFPPNSQGIALMRSRGGASDYLHPDNHGNMLIARAVMDAGVLHYSATPSRRRCGG
ncbi:MAG: SGNH/GDSL hydrolase family protein [Chloroflexota bacterium]|nr:SGNH/GDSL hydrolase family protein [Chloroflexota bacterium]